jgi:hypothetical protein
MNLHEELNRIKGLFRSQHGVVKPMLSEQVTTQIPTFGKCGMKMKPGTYTTPITFGGMIATGAGMKANDFLVIPKDTTFTVSSENPYSCVATIKRPTKLLTQDGELPQNIPGYKILDPTTHGTLIKSLGGLVDQKVSWCPNHPIQFALPGGANEGFKMGAVLSDKLKQNFMI